MTQMHRNTQGHLRYRKIFLIYIYCAVVGPDIKPYKTHSTFIQIHQYQPQKWTRRRTQNCVSLDNTGRILVAKIVMEFFFCENYLDVYLPYHRKLSLHDICLENDFWIDPQPVLMVEIIVNKSHLFKYTYVSVEE